MSTVTGWRKRTIMEMAREAGIRGCTCSGEFGCLKAFAALVREDEAERYKWDIHSCGPTCERYACVAMREAVLAEREACAMVCDELPAPPYVSRNDATVWDVATLECGDSIRARSNT
jgi:hypothetical protein